MIINTLIIVAVGIIATMAMGLASVLTLWPINDKPTSKGQYACFFFFVVVIFYFASMVADSLIN